MLFLSVSCYKDENEQQTVIQKAIFDHVPTSRNCSYLTYALQKTNLDVILSGNDTYTL